MPNRYYTDDQLRDIERARLFQTVMGIGQKDPYYALGLALGQGIGNSIGEHAEQRQINKLNDYVDKTMNPSVQIAMTDAAQKELINPDINKLGQSLQFNGDVEGALGQPIQGVQPQGRIPTEAEIRNFAGNNGISQRIVDNQMPYIRPRLGNGYIGQVENIIANGGLNNNENIAKLYSAIQNYSQIDPQGAQTSMNVLRGLGGLGNRQSGVAKLYRDVGTPRVTPKPQKQVEEKAPYSDAQVAANEKVITEYEYTDPSDRTADMTRKYNLAVAENEKQIRWREERAGLNKEVPYDDYGDFRTQFPEEYEDKPYAELARELGVRPENIANFGRAATPQTTPSGQPQSGQPPAKQVGATNGQGTQTQAVATTYTFNADNDIQRLNSLRNPKDGSELTIEQKRNFVANNPVWTEEQKLALLERLK